MPIVYEEYVWRLRAPILSLDVLLPQDLEWVDEFTWSPVQQTVTTTLTGALVIQENVQLKGKPITLQGKDDMAWITRTTSEELLQMRDTPSLVMNLQYVYYDVDTQTYSGVPLHDYDVMFRHYEPPPLELESVLRYDNFEQTSMYKVRNIKFMEALPSASSPCTANVTLIVELPITGNFTIGDIVTGDDSEVIGTVMSYSAPTLSVYSETSGFTVGEVIRVDASNYATIASIS